jgi:tetratricopeptide (TPR) repeat protein
MRSLLLICLLLFFAIQEARGQGLFPDLVPGIELMNNGQFLESHRFFERYTEDHPENPQALFLLAMIKWKIMWISTYTKSERDDLEQLINKVEAMVSVKKDKDPDALFFFTAVTGLRASIATWENQWWDAAQLGKVMKKNAEHLVELDPNNYDSYYLLGSYNYFADALPGYVKFMRALLFLPSGDKVGGMKQLILANQKGTVTAGEAGRTLAIIYTYFEKQHKYGVQMCDNVLTLYPENYEVGLYKGINTYFQMEWQQSYDWFQHLQEQIQAYSAKHEKQEEIQQSDDFQIVPVYRSVDRESRYWIARARLQQGKYEEAKTLLNKLAKPEIHQPYWLMRGVLLSLAEIAYKEGHPEDAEPLIRRVLKWSDVKDSHDKAKLLKEKKAKIGTFELDFL